jgi:hypothetical protein
MFQNRLPFHKILQGVLSKFFSCLPGFLIYFSLRVHSWLDRLCSQADPALKFLPTEHANYSKIRAQRPARRINPPNRGNLRSTSFFRIIRVFGGQIRLSLSRFPD